MNNITKTKSLLSIPLIAIFFYRIIMLIQNWTSISEYYLFDEGFTIWTIFLILPFISTFFILLSVLFDSTLGITFGIIGIATSMLSLLNEAFTSFVRMIDRNSSFIGAMPLITLLCLILAIISIIHTCNYSNKINRRY